ncbi:MAG TPA: toxin-antitoxin system, toxin component, partial [Pseudomonas sp.]|nr:toxin-antitoxin system, toxin component [Pseudomonas sp.]
MQLPELTQRAQAGEVSELNLLSIEGGFYVLEVLTQDGRTRLTGRDGHFYRLGSAA